MVGDKLSTDIVFGNAGGLKSLLVFTGVTSPSDVDTASDLMVPQFILNDLPELKRLLVPEEQD
jgi:ribonucleotide monophosphatase NagD (HAD superfamily)